MISRHLEPELLHSVQRFPVTGIIGPRQVGKTTLAKSVIEKLPHPALYLDLELPSDAAKLSEAELFLREKQDQIVVLDEVQRIPELFPTLRALIDQDRRPGRFILLGSASPELLRQTSESLAGRINYLELQPFNISEIHRDRINDLWLRGGFPEAYLAQDAESASQWLFSFIKSYIERDLPQLGLSASPVLLRRLLLMLTSIHGTELNYSMLSKSLGVSMPTVKKYIDFLEAAFLVRRLSPFSLNIKKRLVKSPKLFFRDSGILHHLLGIDSLDDLHGHIAIGSSWEGFAIQQIFSLVGEGPNVYFYRTQDGAEVDLLLLKGDRPKMGFEMKFSSYPKLSRGNTIAMKDLKAEIYLIITPGEENYPIRENVRVCGLQHLPRYLQRYGFIK